MVVDELVPEFLVDLLVGPGIDPDFLGGLPVDPDFLDGPLVDPDFFDGLLVDPKVGLQCNHTLPGTPCCHQENFPSFPLDVLVPRVLHQLVLEGSPNDHVDLR